MTIVVSQTDSSVHLLKLFFPYSYHFLVIIKHSRMEKDNGMQFWIFEWYSIYLLINSQMNKRNIRHFCALNQWRISYLLVDDEGRRGNYSNTRLNLLRRPIQRSSSKNIIKEQGTRNWEHLWMSSKTIKRYWSVNNIS